MCIFKTRHLLVMSLLCLASSLLAQDQDVKSPWTVGLELSTALYFEEVPRDRRYTHQVVGGKVGYRLLRWLEPWARYQHHGITAQPSSVRAEEIGGMPGGIAARYSVMDIHSLMLGISALFRIGQGDLGLSVGRGLSRCTGRLRAIDAEGQVTAASFSPFYEQNNFLQLGYTYWPTQHFGVRASISHFSLIYPRSRPIPPGFLFPDNQVNLVDFTNESTGAFRNEDLRNSLALRLSDYTNSWQLGIGIDYRF